MPSDKYKISKNMIIYLTQTTINKIIESITTNSHNNTIAVSILSCLLSTIYLDTTCHCWTVLNRVKGGINIFQGSIRLLSHMERG